MDIQPVRNEEERRVAMAEMERLWSAEAGSEDEARLDVLATLVEAYEDRSFVLPKAPPAEVLRAVMQEKGYVQKDLAEVLGSRSRASEILSGKKEPSVDHIRRIRSAWRVPADALIGEPAERVA